MSNLRASWLAKAAGRCVQLSLAAALLSVCGQALAASDAAAPGEGLLQLRTGDVRTTPGTNFLYRNDGFAAGRFVVQLDGPMTAERHASLTKAGLKLGHYLPENAWLERLDAGSLDALRALPFVTWIGGYDAAWKIDPEIDVRPYSTDFRKGLQAQGLCQVVVVLFESEKTDEAMAALNAAKAQVVDANLIGDQWMIDAILTPAAARGLAALSSVQFVEDAPEGAPRNDSTRWIIQSNVSTQVPIWNAGITGLGQVGGVIDGTPRESHCMFDDTVAPGPSHRKFIGWRNASGTDLHGTHVSGTMAGDAAPFGVYNLHDGIAYRAKLTFSNSGSIWSSPSTLEPRLNDQFNDGGRVHSNSWGDDGTTAYTTWCRQIDLHTWNNQDSVVAFAVSNQSTLKTPENSVNVLAVGATNDTPGQANRCYGGTGPTADGRRKPEIYAPGCDTTSASNSTCGTTQLSGTSMACPAISGAGLLVRQYYTDGFYPSGTANASDAITPTGALIRATLLNGTVDMTGVTGYPSNSEGWGRLLLDNALYFPADTTRKLWIQDVRNAQGLSTGQEVEFQVQCDGSQTPLRITLVYTAPPAAVNAGNPVINNLDLEVVAPSSSMYRGNVFTSGQSSTGGTADNKNSVEQFLLTSPAAGTYTVRVKGTAVNQGPQGFALVATGNIAPGACGGATITQDPVDSTVDEGSPTSFLVLATGSGLEYQWRRNGENLVNNGRISGANSLSLLINPVIAGDEGEYDVVVDNGCEPVTSGAATLTINNSNPCPPDVDGNPGLDVSDIFYFLNLWFAGDLQADWDGANGVDVPDIFGYLTAWFTGC